MPGIGTGIRSRTASRTMITKKNNSRIASAFRSASFVKTFSKRRKAQAEARREEAERDKSECDDQKDQNFSGELQHRAAARRIHFKKYFWIPDLDGVSGRLQDNRFRRGGHAFPGLSIFRFRSQFCRWPCLKLFCFSVPH